jgi:hypothetical protein
MGRLAAASTHFDETAFHGPPFPRSGHADRQAGYRYHPVPRRAVLALLVYTALSARTAEISYGE